MKDILIGTANPGKLKRFGMPLEGSGARLLA